MRAMVLEERGPLSPTSLVAREVPDPDPSDGEILVRVRACAVCRTDLHEVEGDLPRAKLPVVPGHQAVGVVERAGRGSRRFRPGDRVGIAWLRSTCGRCAFCRSGTENLCPESRYTGHHEDGGYAELALVREDFAYAIPDGFSDVEAAPLLCAGIIGYRALARSGLARGGRLGLFGFGSSAHLVLALARHRGCEVLVATRGAGHRTLATELGAAWTGATFDPPPSPLDAAIVFAPAGEIVPAALRAVRPGGTVVLAGIHVSDVPPLRYEECLFHEKTLTSVEANTRADGRELLREAVEAGIRPRTVVFPLDRAGEALSRLKDDAIDGTGVLVVAP
jgi:propanol-preferring alcohol dehydrogenase